MLQLHLPLHRDIFAYVCVNEVVNLSFCYVFMQE
jgi:hypothetical protein